MSLQMNMGDDSGLTNKNKVHVPEGTKLHHEIEEVSHFRNHTYYF